MQASHSVHFKILNGGEVSFVLGTLVVFLYKSKTGHSIVVLTYL
ncbi:Uncharacterised protein [Haemophilus aegyptius]|nr:Uncharacterised protein [Haemophilus aegyptius]